MLLDGVIVELRYNGWTGIPYVYARLAFSKVNSSTCFCIYSIIFKCIRPCKLFLIEVKWWWKEEEEEMWKHSHLQKLSSVPKVLLDSHTLRSWGGSRGLRDSETERVRWSRRKGKKTLEPNAKVYVRGFWIAELHSWVAGQDTDRTARRMPNGPAKTDALLFLVHLSLSSSPLVCRSVSVYFRALTLFLFFIFLHVVVHLSCCLPHEFSPTYSILYRSLFSLFLSLSIFLLPSPTEQ